MRSSSQPAQPPSSGDLKQKFDLLSKSRLTQSFSFIQGSTSLPSNSSTPKSSTPKSSTPKSSTSSSRSLSSYFPPPSSTTESLVQPFSALSLKQKEEPIVSLPPNNSSREQKTDLLTEEQRLICQANPSLDICINAAPGSGKTTTLVFRILQMNRVFQIPLKEICLLTYNRFLAKDIWIKLRKYGINASDLGWSGTLHGLCYQETHVHNDLRPWILRHQHELNPFPNFKYIIFDEYQDVDPEMAKVIEILSRCKWLTIVGDERQQIYGYKGADANLLLNLRNYTRFPLSRSFRCSPPICHLLSKLYPSYPPIHAFNEYGTRDAFNSKQNNSMKPQLYRSIGRTMHNPEIIEMIIQIIKTNPRRSFAIISPVVNSEVASKFLNDLHSNIKARTGVEFECRLGDTREEVKGKSNVITSVHGVKGKEYHTVILLNTIDHPNFYDYPSSEALSKLFVALSRAQTELHVFEHRYHDSTGSLRWISQHEDLFDLVPNWIQPIRDRDNRGDNPDRIFSCVEFTRTLTAQQQLECLKGWSEPEIVDADMGLTQSLGSPDLFNPFIEALLIMKYAQVKPEFKFDLYLSQREWESLHQRIIPQTVLQHLQLIYPGSMITWKGRLAQIVRPIADNIGSTSTDISGSVGRQIPLGPNNIVSNLIYREYYDNLPMALSQVSELTLELTIENIQRLWQIFRFIRLTRSSLTGFQSPDLDSLQLGTLVNYLNSELPLRKLDCRKGYTKVKGLFNPSSRGIQGRRLHGRIGIVGPDFIMEIRSPQSQAELWVQLELEYELLKNPQIKTLYIYNPILGELWSRTRLQL